MNSGHRYDRRTLITGAWTRARTSREVIRPPGAVGPERFFDLCDGCGDCAEACPADAIVMTAPVQKRGGPSPEIKARDAACVMCDGLVCTTSCPTGALEPAQPEPRPTYCTTLAHGQEVLQLL